MPEASQAAREPGATAAPRDELLDLLIAATGEKFQRDEIDPAANIFEYGYIDSLSGVAFLASIEERFGIEIDDMEIVERLFTLDALAEHVAAH